MVEVAGAGVGGAPGEDAVLVAQDDVFARPGRSVVAIDGVGGVRAGTPDVDYASWVPVAVTR